MSVYIDPVHIGNHRESKAIKEKGGRGSGKREAGKGKGDIWRCRHTNVRPKISSSLDFYVEVLVDFADDFDGVADLQMGVLSSENISPDIPFLSSLLSCLPNLAACLHVHHKSRMIQLSSVARIEPRSIHQDPRKTSNSKLRGKTKKKGELRTRLRITSTLPPASITAISPRNCTTFPSMRTMRCWKAERCGARMRGVCGVSIALSWRTLGG